MEIRHSAYPRVSGVRAESLGSEMRLPERGARVPGGVRMTAAPVSSASTVFLMPEATSQCVSPVCTVGAPRRQRQGHFAA
ncbi:hypothetical protein MRX96_005590 [Rhipicephalus microplus]